MKKYLIIAIAVFNINLIFCQVENGDKIFSYKNIPQGKSIDNVKSLSSNSYNWEESKWYELSVFTDFPCLRKNFEGGIYQGSSFYIYCYGFHPSLVKIFFCSEKGVEEGNFLLLFFVKSFENEDYTLMMVQKKQKLDNPLELNQCPSLKSIFTTNKFV